MGLAKANPNARNSSDLEANPKAKESIAFDKESKRKFLWHYVSVKERQLLEGDSIGGA
jgi:hypothetical protein